MDAATPAAAEYVVWDDGGKETIKGFGLKVTPAGAKIYLYQYRLARPGSAAQTAPRKYTIGKHGDLTPDQARNRVRELATMVAHGIDPRQSELDAISAADEARFEAERQARIAADLAFEVVAERWLAEYELGHRPRSYGQAKLVINRHLRPTLKGKPLPSITRANLQSIIDNIPASQPANRRTVYAYASIFFGWAYQRGNITENPTANMPKPKGAKPRERVLTDDELATVWRATGALRSPLGAFYRMLILTGQRREEVTGMDWAELDRSTATWTIPAGRAKNGIAHLVPLSSAALREIDEIALAKQSKDKDGEPDGNRWPKAGPVMSIRGDVALSCFSQAKKLLDTEVAKLRKDADPLPAWRVHDLRRTMATGFQRLGVRFEVTEATLNHVSGAKGGVAGIYQRHDWKEEKRSALDAWSRHVLQTLAATGDFNVVPLNVRR